MSGSKCYMYVCVYTHIHIHIYNTYIYTIMFFSIKSRLYSISTHINLLYGVEIKYLLNENPFWGTKKNIKSFFVVGRKIIYVTQVMNYKLAGSTSMVVYIAEINSY